MSTAVTRRFTAASLSALLVAAIAAPVAAHVGIQTTRVVRPGDSATIGFRILHGCGELATDTVMVQIPEGVTAVQAAWVPGWTVETDIVETEPYEQNGEQLTERVGVVRWTGGDLPTELFYDFTISATFPDEAGKLIFPLVQQCGAEELAWIQTSETASEGETLEFPAPALTLVAETAAGSGKKKTKGKPEPKPKSKPKKADDGHDHEHG